VRELPVAPAIVLLWHPFATAQAQNDARWASHFLQTVTPRGRRTGIRRTSGRGRPTPWRRRLHEAGIREALPGASLVGLDAAEYAFV